MSDTLARSWPSSSKFYHWVISILIICMIIGGLTWESLEAPTKFTVLNFHKATGILVLVLMALRLANRLGKVIPALPSDMPGWQVGAAKLSHFMLYLLAFVMPISGYTMSVAGGYPVSMYGLFTLPSLIGKSKAIGGIAHEIHEYTAFVLIAFIILHILAALYHHFGRKDGLLRAMLP